MRGASFLDYAELFHELFHGRFNIPTQNTVYPSSVVEENKSALSTVTQTMTLQTKARTYGRTGISNNHKETGILHNYHKETSILHNNHEKTGILHNNHKKQRYTSQQPREDRYTSYTKDKKRRSPGQA